MVRMGDNETLVPIREILRIEVKFVKQNGEERIGKVDFAVMPTNGGVSAILGLPDILNGFLDIFIDLLETSGPIKSSRPSLYMLNLEELKDKYPETIDSWTEPAEEMSPEAAELDDMHTFSMPLYYLTKPYDEMLADYHSLLETHISPEWKQDQRLMDVLTSEKALKVFLPREWTGIKGIDPIELDFSPEMPTTHRPKVLPINP